MLILRQNVSRETVFGGMCMFILMGTVKSSKIPFWFSPKLRRNCFRKRHYHRQYKLTGLKYWCDKYNMCRTSEKKIDQQYDTSNKRRVEGNLITHPRYVGNSRRNTKNKIKIKHVKITFNKEGCNFHSPPDVAQNFCKI